MFAFLIPGHFFRVFTSNKNARVPYLPFGFNNNKYIGAGEAKTSAFKGYNIFFLLSLDQSL